MNKKKKKPTAEYRYLQAPSGSYFLALFGRVSKPSEEMVMDIMHFHNYMEIGFCIKGSGTIVLGETEYRFSDKTLTVIPKNYLHATNHNPNTEGEWEYLYVDVAGFLADTQNNPVRAEKMVRRINSKAFCLKEAEYTAFSHKIHLLLDVLRKREEFFQEEATGLLLAALADLARMNSDAGEWERSESGKVANMVSKSLDYISEHYAENIKISDLADACHASETHFRRVFSSYMNVSPLEYVNLVRIQNACELLKKTDDSVNNIAYHCGFTTNSTFNRNFKRLMGQTPVEWRGRHENYERQLLNFTIMKKEKT